MGNMKEIGLLDCEDRPSIEENFKRVAKNHGYISTEEKTAQYDPESGEDLILDGFPVFKVGDTVKVTVDGVEYSLVANEFLGTPNIGDNPEELSSGNYKYGWYVAYYDGNVFFGGMEPHTVSWKATINHPIDHKFLPEGYPYTKDIVSVFIDEDITVTSSYYENSQFYYSFGWELPATKVGATYDVTFLGETIKDLTVTNDGAPITFTLSNGATIDVGGNAIISHVNDGLARPFTTRLKIVEHKVDVVPMDAMFIPSIAMKVYTDDIDIPQSSNAIGTATLRNLYYDDGTEITYSTSKRLIDTINAGFPVYVYWDNARRGEIWFAENTETSDGYKLYAKGIICCYYSQRPSVFSQGF